MRPRFGPAAALVSLTILSATVILLAGASGAMVVQGSRDPVDLAGLALGVAVPTVALAASTLVLPSPHLDAPPKGERLG